MNDSTRTRLLDFIPDLTASRDPETALTSLTDLARELTASDAASILRLPQPAKADNRLSMTAPILLRGELLGVIEVSRPAGGPGYSDDEITTLETLASLAAFTLHEQDLHQHVGSSQNEKAELDHLKEEFIAITSHELRTPLGLILGHATFLRELSSEHHEHLDMIIRYATRLKDIVESLSNVDNYTSGAARVRQNQVSISDLIRETVTLYEEQASAKNVTIHIAMTSPALTVEGEAGKLGIALGNLIKNAVTFSNPGGRVTVSAESDNEFVKVSVADEGIGIPAADLPRVFDRFYQVETHLTRKHGGMGLGLTVAKAMIEMHGGQILVESEEGKGSTFSFRLPVERLHPAA
jgi:signal transduction histidine kinase